MAIFICHTGNNHVVSDTGHDITYIIRHINSIHIWCAYIKSGS